MLLSSFSNLIYKLHNRNNKVGKFIVLLICLLITQKNSFAQDNSIFFDDFKDNKNNWPVGKNPDYKVTVNGGRSLYLIQHNRTTALKTCWINIPVNENKNFKIEALFYKEKGVKNYGYGILWGGNDVSYYFFLISATGYYCVGYVENGIWKDITPKGWIKTSTVKLGNNHYHKLAVSKIGDTYHFDINSVKIATMKCGPFFGNNIGFNVNNKQRIAVDWIKVEYLN